MSSHHIVREKQEPALLVLGMGDFNYEQLGQLLEWSPTVIATVQTSELLLSLNIKIDWVFSDSYIEDLQAETKNYLVDGELPKETALNFLINEGYPSVNIISEDFIVDDYSLFVKKINMVIFCQQKKIYAINSGYSKWKSKGEQLEIISKSKTLNFEGLKCLKKNIFETSDNGFFNLHFQEEHLFIAESL
jgi:thiamine pyrophosphokinase